MTTQTDLLAPEPPREEERTAKVTPLAPERFALQVTTGEETREKLFPAQALMRRQVPSGDLARWSRPGGRGRAG